MTATAWVLTIAGAVLQLGGVGLVFYDIAEDRREARKVLTQRGTPDRDLKAALEVMSMGAAGYPVQQTIADLVALKEWLSGRLEDGLGRRATGAWLVLVGIVVATAGALTGLAA